MYFRKIHCSCSFPELFPGNYDPGKPSEKEWNPFFSKAKKVGLELKLRRSSHGVWTGEQN